MCQVPMNLSTKVSHSSFAQENGLDRLGLQLFFTMPFASIKVNTFLLPVSALSPHTLP